MKSTLKSLFTICLLLITLSAFGQDIDNPGIRERINTFINLTNSKHYSEAFDMMYPRMFEHVSKEELIDIMSSMDQNGMSIRVSDPKITTYSEPLKVGDETFVRVDYTADMNIDITPGSAFDAPKSCHAMLQQFESTYGSSNVKWNPESKSFGIATTKSMMAIKQNTGNWFLVEINPDEMDLMKALFPEAVVSSYIAVK